MKIKKWTGVFRKMEDTRHPFGVNDLLRFSALYHMKDFVCKNKSYSSGIRDYLPHFLKSNNLKINKLLELQVKMSWKPQTPKQTLKRLISPFQIHFVRAFI